MYVDVRPDPTRTVVRGLRARARALGVTRVARLTGLDVSGVEVACAVRPLGHVLQVCNGKGSTFERAAQGALSEAAELAAAERPDPLGLRYASVEELRGRARFVAPEVFGPAGALVAPSLYTARVRLGWISGRSLLDGAEVLVPAQAVFCPPADGPQLGPSLLRWTSNGLAAHPTRGRALRHALLEVLERDRLASALPGGWTPAMARRRMVRAPPGALERMARAFPERGLELFLFDLTARGGPPLGGALLFGARGGPVPLSAGYACRARASEALLAAAQEAAQSRLTDIHGAREDVDLAPASVRDMEALRRACRAVRPRPFRDRAVAGNALDLAARCGGEVVAVDLGTWGGLRVVKVVAPSLRTSRLL